MLKFKLILKLEAIQGNHMTFLFSGFWETYNAQFSYRNFLIAIDGCTSCFGITGMISSYYRVSFNGQCIAIL